MERILVACRGDRFLVELPEPGPRRPGHRLIASAAIGSILLHGLVPLALGLLHRPSDPVSASAEIPIEVVIATPLPAPREPPRQEPPEPPPSHAAAWPESGKAPPEGLGPPGMQHAAAPPRPARQAERPLSLGLEQESVRAVPVPKAVERGDEAIRYDVIVLGRLERAKQFPRPAALRGARGTAVVGFGLDETGRVVVAALLRSSGDRDLDGESLAVIRRAAPFPKPPAGARRRFALDISFGMGG